MSATLTVACVQLSAGRELEPNIANAVKLGREARRRGAQLIAYPENAVMIEPDNAAALKKAQPESEHPGLKAFRELARATGAWILAGSLSIGRGARKYCNRSFLIDDAGAIVARYDKLHMFDVDLPGGERHRESDRVAAGDRAVLAATPWGVVGLTVCYDVRFPELYRALAKAGASILTIPSAFTAVTGRAHWHVLVRARAIECGAFVLAPAQCGTHAAGRRTYGHSLIVDPWGAVLAEGGEEETIVLADLDLKQSAEARRRIPALQHDRAFAAPEVPVAAQRPAAE